MTQFSGRLDGGSSDDNRGGTEVTLRGRDAMARLVDTMLVADVSFTNCTFAELATACIKGAGLGKTQDTAYSLVYSRTATRKAVTGVPVIEEQQADVPLVLLAGTSRQNRPQLIQQFLNQDMTAFGPAAQAAGYLPGPTPQTITVAGQTITAPQTIHMTQERITGYRTAQPIQGKAGRDSWYSFSHKEFERGGLFLHAGVDPEGQDEFVYILDEPRATVPALYGLIRQKGPNAYPKYVPIEHHKYTNDTAGRHGTYRIFGRAGSGAGGRSKIEGTYVDPEMLALGLGWKHFCKEDKDAKSKAQAQYLARRWAAEARRKHWNLIYTVKGHSAPWLQGTGRAVWDIDTVVRVYDDTLQLYGDYWIESVVFRCGPDGTFTDLRLRRPEDLVYGEGEFYAGPAPKKRARKSA